MKKKKLMDFKAVDDSQAIQSTESPIIPDVLQASRTGHIKQLRLLILDKKIRSPEQLAQLSDTEVQQLVNNVYCCFYIRSTENGFCDMGTLYLIPRELAVKSAILIER